MNINTIPDKASDKPKARCKSNRAIKEATMETMNTADCLKHVVDQLLMLVLKSSSKFKFFYKSQY